MGRTSISPEVSALAKSLGREYGIDIILAERGVRNVRARIRARGIQLIGYRDLASP